MHSCSALLNVSYASRHCELSSSSSRPESPEVGSGVGVGVGGTVGTGAGVAAYGEVVVAVGALYARTPSL